MNALGSQTRDAVADIPGIAALLLFGSRARGTPRFDSDLDIAVLPDGASRGDPCEMSRTSPAIPLIGTTITRDAPATLGLTGRTRTAATAAMLSVFLDVALFYRLLGVLGAPYGIPLRLR